MDQRSCMYTQQKKLPAGANADADLCGIGFRLNLKPNSDPMLG